ncbi:MAG: hypothetical protein B6D61_10150, partial [Bacteroidetes bacterium 4484_249]
WPSLSNDFTTYSASADHYISALSGGVGVIFTSDNAGSGMMNSMRISGIYSYHLKISNSIKLNAGLEATFHQQKINWDKLVYADMIDPVSGVVNPANSGEPTMDNTSVSTPDFSAGLVLGIKEKYYIGIATHHLAEPNLNFYSNSENNLLYRKYTFHAGAYFNLGERNYRSGSSDFFLSPNVLYQYQQGAQQINLGLYIQRTPLVVGVWYRHNIENADGAIFLVGLKLKRFNFGYSYDLTMSKLSNATGGAHEVSVTMLFNCNKKRNRPGAIKCPEF